MTTSRPPADYVGYAERREYSVATNLSHLTGPTSGFIRLPIHLDWSGSPEYNLDNPARLAHMYEVVLREASRTDDLSTLLDADTLLRLWPVLFLPAKVRRIWEERFPELAQARIDAQAA